MFSFYWPWLGLLILLPYLFRILCPAKKIRNHNKQQIYFPEIERLEKSYGAAQEKSNNLSLYLLSLIWLCLCIALMRPQIVNQHTYSKTKGYDLMLAVDISSSMKALDFTTQKDFIQQKYITRLDITKEVVGKFVQDRQGDRIGLILFGTNAYLHVPLTLDTISVAKMLNNALPGMAGETTAIGDAIGLAVKNLRQQQDGSRVIILLTDGEDTASKVPPLEALKLAIDYNIKIYTIGVGRKGLVPYPANGRIVQAQMNFNNELLQEIANKTGGRYFSAENKSGLEKIYAEINQLEKTESEAKEFLIRKPLFRYPLITGLVLFVCYCLVMIKERRVLI